MQKPLLTLIIPTKNRYFCLKEVLSCLLTFSNDQIEYVIQDNSADNEDFCKFFERLNDKRFKYFYTKDNLSVVDNADKAILNSSGKYVCFIGDDDMIIDNIMDMVKLMEERGMDSLIQYPVAYYWQDITFKYSNRVQKPGSFLISNNLKLEFEKINVKNELKHVILSGGTSIGNLPKIYHGIVKRSLLELVYSQCNTYFPGASPDMASSTALAHFTDNCYFVKMPFSISGKSAISTSGMGVAHTHAGKLESMDFLPKNILQVWDEKIPKFWSCSTIWAQSLSSALLACGSKKHINYNKLYANLLIFEPSYGNQIMMVVNNGSNIKGSFYKLNLFLNVGQMFISRGVNFLKRKLGFYSGVVTYHQINTIEECYLKVNSIVRNTPIS